MINTKSMVIPFSKAFSTAGTWSNSLASNVQSYSKSAGDQTGVTVLPLELPAPHNESYIRGMKIKNIKLPYSVATAALDAAPTFKLYKTDLSGSAPSASEVTTEVSGNVATVGNNKAVLDVNNDVIYDGQCQFHLEFGWNAAATSVLSLLGGALVEFEEVDDSKM